MTSSPPRPSAPMPRAAVIAFSAAIVALVGGLVAALLGFSATRGPAESSLSWPAVGSAAVEIDGVVHLGPNAEQAAPIASIAKLVTAMVALDRLPLQPGQPGPSFELTEEDTAFVDAERSHGGTVFEVTPGDTITQRQLIEYMLVASSNNHARTLAARIFGDETAYVVAARRWLDDHGLAEIRVSDSTGLSPDDTATPDALLKLGRLAAANPLIAEIVAMPAIGDGPTGIPSTNAMLGTLGVDGLKTGHTDAAGYTVLLSARNGEQSIVAVILGSPSEAQRTTDATRLLASLRAPD